MGLRSRVRDAGARSWQRVRSGLWPLVQQTAAAALAWFLADQYDGHEDAFFAPIAAVVALNTTRGQRGVNALQLLVGVILGIGVGEVVLLLLGGGYGTVALAVFLSTVLARAVVVSPLVVAQAAAAAILTVVSAGDDAGPYRLVDALIGAGVALVFSQLLFPPEPVELLRRAEAKALDDIAEGLDLTTRALRKDDDRLREEALARLREQREELANLSRMAKASTSVPRYAPIWRSRRELAVREREDAGHLDLLAGNCVLVSRTALVLGAEQRREIVPAVRDLALAVRSLAADPGDREVRRNAAAQAVELATWVAESELENSAYGRDAATALRMAATDVLVFTGVEPMKARGVVRSGAGRYHVPVPPHTVHLPQALRRLWRRRRSVRRGRLGDDG